MTRPKYPPGDWRAQPRHNPRTELLEKQVLFLEWLVDPDIQLGKPTLRSIADELQLDPSTLSHWKKEPLFVEAWNKRLSELNVSPERTQRLVEQMYLIASGETESARTADQIKAMELYLRFVEKISPPRLLVEAVRPAHELSDAQLADQLEAEAQSLRSRAIDVPSRQITTGAELRAELARDLASGE